MIEYNSYRIERFTESTAASQLYWVCRQWGGICEALDTLQQRAWEWMYCETGKVGKYWRSVTGVWHDMTGQYRAGRPDLDPEYGMLYLQNSNTTSALDSLGANLSRICLSRALNHGALWHIVFLRPRNILTYLLTYLHTAPPNFVFQ